MTQRAPRSVSGVGRAVGSCAFTTLLLVSAASAAAAEVRVAAASNFAAAAREIADVFERETGHDVRLAFASTGKHFAQISNGAPVDVFLAADAMRPALLEENGMAIAGSRLSYARGRLVLWSPRAGYASDGARVLDGGEFRHLAIANPRHAPYGVAARQVLEALDLWERLAGRIVRGENIGQALQFVDSGNAELGFVAASQVVGRLAEHGSVWEVPQDLHTPIEQQAVLLTAEPVAREFMSFLTSERGLEIIRANGYEAP